MKKLSSKVISTLIIVGICLLLVVVLGACTGFSETETPLTKVTVSEVTHSVFYAPQYVAYNLGFFKDEGIDLEIINSQGADKVMTSVLSNQVDIGFAGPEATIYVYNEGKEEL